VELHPGGRKACELASAVPANRPKNRIPVKNLRVFQKIEKISIENPLSYGKY
jgi:hypothetical protein